MTTEQPKPPVIKCLPRPDFPDGMMFYCPWCKRFHFHGIGNGHRGAHCITDSPYRSSGYYIQMIPKAELRNIAKAIKLYLESIQ